MLSWNEEIFFSVFTRRNKSISLLQSWERNRKIGHMFHSRQWALKLSETSTIQKVVHLHFLFLSNKKRETGKVSLLLWCGSCSFGTPLYAHLFSLNHTCKQVGSAFLSYRLWIEFKTPGSSSLFCWCTFKVVQHNSVELCRSKPACEFHALSMIFQTTSSTFQDSKI